METRVCNRCNIEKPLTDFEPTYKKPGTRRGTCKACRQEQQWQRYVPKTNRRRKGEPRICRVCGSPLIAGDNWGTSEQNKQRNMCKTCRNAYRKIRREANPERIKAQKRAYYQRNKEAIKAKRRAYRATRTPEQREHDYQMIQAWKKRNPERESHYAAHAYAKRRGAIGSHTEEEWQMYLDMAEHKCLACGRDGPLTKDHILPLIKGGTDNIHNIQPLCQSCNSRKHAQFINYWIGT